VSLRRIARLAVMLAALPMSGPAAQAQFETRAIFPVPCRPYSLMAGDFNRDGIPDVAVVDDSGSGSVEILLGNGDGTLSWSTAPAIRVRFPALAAGNPQPHVTSNLAPHLNSSHNCPSKVK
jgi:hypothetical protein